MTILTASEAANAIRVDATDADLLALLPLVDAFVNRATGRDWTQDGTINNLAKNAARMLIVQWYDNPAQVGDGNSLAFGLKNTLMQLESEALKYRKYEFEGINGGGSIYIHGAREGDDVIKLVGTYGASGDQTDKFESEISEENQIVQTSTDDLSEKHYVVILKNPADDITA